MTEADVDFAEQYFYETSTANQQIEAWWSQLTKSQMYHWQVCLSSAWIVWLCLCWYTFQNYFIELTDDGLYNHSHLEDWIVFLTVYMSIIQWEIFKFIQLWNNHTVQQQRNWLNAVTDKPIMLYHYSATVSENYETPISQDVLNEVETLFNDWDMFCMFSVFIQSWSIDLNKYLSATTLNWCVAQLQTLNVDLQSVDAENAFSDEERPHCIIYLQLWTIIQSHLELQMKSILSKLIKSQAGLINVTKLQELRNKTSSYKTVMNLI
jgi:hypothetical protein